MSAQDKSTTNSSFRSVLKQTGKSFLWKLFIVLAGVGAYYSLNSMETTKGTYDKARNASVVVVDVLGSNSASAVAASSPAPDSRPSSPSPISTVSPAEASSQGSPTDTESTKLTTSGTVEIKTDHLKKLFDDDKDPIRSAPQAKATPTPEPQWSTDLKTYVDRVKYQPFKDGDELLDRLKDEILKGQAAEERARQQQIDILDKQYAANQTNLFTQRNEKGCNTSEDESPDESTDCKEIKEKIKRSNTDYTEDSKFVKNQVAAIYQRTEDQVKTVYERLRPKLLAEVKREKDKQPIRSFAYLFPSNVLDEKNGSHVIYSVFWLTCMVILVFGVLFVVLLLLRPLPPFAGGTEALSEQAKSLLTKRGASLTPELAKTIVVTTAALGIGTAVAVAGGVNMPTVRNADVDQYQAALRIMETNRTHEPLGPPPGPQATPVVNVTAVAPVTYTSPMVVNVPSADGTRIDALARDMGRVDGDVQTLRSNYGALNSKVSGIDNTVSYTVQPLVAKLDEASKQIDLAQRTLRTDLDLANTNIGALQGQADSLKLNFFTKMDSFNTTLQNLRNDQLSQSKPTGARNIFTAARQVFGFGSERYLVTEQSYLLLQSMICTVKAKPAPSTSPSVTPPPSPGLCSLKTDCNCDSAQDILSNLRDLIGQGPMTETAFMKKFSGNEAKLKIWKPIILKYTRVL